MVVFIINVRLHNQLGMALNYCTKKNKQRKKQKINKQKKEKKQQQQIHPKRNKTTIQENNSPKDH